MKNLRWLIAAALMPLPWLFIELTGGGQRLLTSHPGVISILAGLAIVGAAFLLGWGAELAERDIPRSLALIALALISVLPEYAVDLHFAWEAGKNPEYKAYAIANMTGANRLLIGVGWALVAIVYYFRHRRKEVPIDRSQTLELSLLLLATGYSFVIPLKGALSWVDALVFFAMFLYYAGRAARGEKHDGDLEGIAGELDRLLSDGARRLVALLMFAFAGYAIWLSAEPFAEGLVATGKSYHVSEFLLVQWLAPFASESPEVVIALLFAFKGKGSTGIGALISSKINQWTLLVGAIPLVYALSHGALEPMNLDHRQNEELLLTSAQSLFAVVIISDFRFALWDALLLLILFLAQWILPIALPLLGLGGCVSDETVRYHLAFGYLALALSLLLLSKQRRLTLWRALLLKGYGSD
jgi:cation:H+ antiporter